MTNRVNTERQDIVLRLLLARDEEGMRQLFRHYSGAIMAIIKPIVGSGEMAEEVLQDVLMRIWNNVESYDGSKSRLFTWMARIARNASIDKTRSRDFKTKYRTDGLEGSVGNTRAHSATIPTDGIGVANLLNRLDDDHRQLIELLYLRDFTQSEAAKELNIPLGTVKTRSRRALQQLRKLLGNEISTVALVILLSEHYHNL